jgi:hypothetical protein
MLGNFFSPRKLVIGALEKAMHRAWGLHGPTQFKNIGGNRFLVIFKSERDWPHATKHGPWKFDFNAVVL